LRFGGSGASSAQAFASAYDVVPNDLSGIAFDATNVYWSNSDWSIDSIATFSCLMVAACASGSSRAPGAQCPGPDPHQLAGRAQLVEHGRPVTVDARRERLARSVHDTPPVGSRAIPPRGAAPGVGIVSHRRLGFGLPPSVRFTAGFPRAPRGPRYPRVCPSADAGR